MPRYILTSISEGIKVSDVLLNEVKKPRAETCRTYVRPTDRREVNKINLFIFYAGLSKD